MRAQEDVYPRAVEELRAGRKRTHWMWFVFPQMAGLGWSPMARRFAITGRAEAKAYLQHPVLGPRLAECSELVLAARPGTTVSDVFDYPDDLKFRSSMTLFGAVAAKDSAFQRVLERFFGGQGDKATLDLLAQAG